MISLLLVESIVVDGGAGAVSIYQMGTVYMDNGETKACIERQLSDPPPSSTVRSAGLVVSHTGFDTGARYRLDRDCFIVLQAPVGYRIRLVAFDFVLPNSPTCADDSLTVFGVCSI